MARVAAFTRTFRSVVTLVLALLLGGQAAAQAECVQLDGSGGERFGSGVALSGMTLLVGADRSDSTSPTDARALVYRRTSAGWTLDATLRPSDPGLQDRFGFATALDGDFAWIGAPFDNGSELDSGSAYAFERSGAVWVERAKRRGSSEEQERRFGTSVAVSGTWAAVGAPGPVSGPYAGRVHLFERSASGWPERQILAAPDGHPADRFGVSLALDAGRLLVGAADHDHGGAFHSGAAYVFERVGSSWQFQAELVATGSAASDAAGSAVALVGERAVVGAPFADAAVAATAGAAFVFDAGPGGWTQVARLEAPDASPFEQFGSAVALTPGGAAVGVQRDDDAGSGAGAVWFFTRRGQAWPATGKLLAAGAEPSDGFGTALDADGDTLAASAPRAALERGRVSLLCASAGTTLACSSAPHSGGLVAGLALEGSPFLPAQDGVLATASAPALRAGLFFFGPRRAPVPFGDGVLCVDSVSAQRLQPVVQTDAMGRAVLSLAASPAAAALTDGSTFTFQFWFRDANGPLGSGVNVSDGLEVRFCR